MRSIFLTLAVTLSSAYGLVSAYHVEPVKASLSGWTTFQNNSVSQIVRCCWDELDSASTGYVELFQGDTGRGSQYTLDIYEYPGGTRVARDLGRHATKPQSWLRFDRIHIEPGRSFTKGKLYELRFTRSGSDSLEYYYRLGDCYPYGVMLVPGGPTPEGGDLAARVYGRMNPVSDVWRACVNHGNDPPGGGADTALMMADSMGVKWIRDDFTGWVGWEWIRNTVIGMYNRYLTWNFSMIGVLCYGPPYDSWSSGVRHDPTFQPSWYLPRNLWPKEKGDTNYWARYCHDIMTSMPAVKFWEVWNEPNTPWGPRDPDTAFYKGSTAGPKGDSWIDTWRERCSLYVRMCYVAESVSHDLDRNTAQQRRKILAGVTYRLLDGDGVSMMPGVEWLRNVFDLAEHRYGGVESCFDIASVHAYMYYADDSNPSKDMLWFKESLFQRDLDTARSVMRQAGHPGMELWATEYGWARWRKETSPPRPLTDTLTQARNVCQFYVSAIARQADPRGGYDRAIHYELTGHHRDSASTIENGGHGLLDTFPSQRRLPSGWAFTQLDSALAGKRLNGRVITGNSTTDPLVRMYEFEDPVALKKTWVCWRNQPPTAPPLIVTVKLPARSDTTFAAALDYGDHPSPNSNCADADGWLRENVGTRPVFIAEKSNTSRPDLVVDSVKYIPQAPDAVLAWVTNRGNRATPRQSPGNQPYPTWAVLYADGDSLTQQVCTDSIGVNQQVTFKFNLGITQPSSALLAVKVNPAQTYVELGTDDNAGYVLKP